MVVLLMIEISPSLNPNDYWFKIKIRQMKIFEPSTICRQLKLEAPDGKMRETLCTRYFRIIQHSVTQPNIKRWLCVGYERIQEIENPELAQERMKQLYEKNYSKLDW